MSYQMTATFEGDLLHVHVTAQDSYETSLRFFTELADVCRKHDCRRILAVSDSTPLSIMAAFDHHEILSNVGFTMQYSLAWVEKNPEARKIDEFIEDVLANRAVIRARVFSDESDGRQWLLAD